MNPIEANVTIQNSKRPKGFWHEIKKNRALYSLTVPGILLLLVFSYLPMLGIIIAFKDYNYEKGPIFSKWSGFRNFKFFLQTPDAFVITRNVVLYNIAFLITGILISTAFAIVLNEIRVKTMAKLYQTVMIMPFFISWVVGGYLLFSLLSMDKGFLNTVLLKFFGQDPVMWYNNPSYWPVIIVLANTWKYAGYNSVIYLAAIAGIDEEMFEAAIIDGASKWQQIKSITIPMLVPMMCILALLQVGKMFSADFGMFFNLTLDTGVLFPTTNVIDTYVYRAMASTNDIGMSAAAGLYQSVVGFILIMISNYSVKKVSPERALF